MDSLMNSVNTHVYRAVNEAISIQILPQIQNMIRELKESTQGPSQSEGPEPRPEQPIPLNSVSSSKNIIKIYTKTVNTLTEQTTRTVSDLFIEIYNSTTRFYVVCLSTQADNAIKMFDCFKL